MRGIEDEHRPRSRHETMKEQGDAGGAGPVVTTDANQPLTGKRDALWSGKREQLQSRSDPFGHVEVRPVARLVEYVEKELTEAGQTHEESRADGILAIGVEDERVQDCPVALLARGGGHADGDDPDAGAAVAEIGKEGPGR